jgi:PmbA protein
MNNPMKTNKSFREIETLLQETVASALKLGADAADALYVQGTSLSYSSRNLETEHLERSEGNDLGLRVFVGKKQAIISTSLLDQDALPQMIDQAVKMARLVPEDPYCGLADPKDHARDIPNLDTCDTLEDDEAYLMDLAKRTEKAALEVKGVTNTEGAQASWSKSQMMLVTSTGFVGTYEDSSRSFSVSVIAGEGSGMERDYDFSASIYRETLKSPEFIGRLAAERAVKRLNPRKISSTKVPVIFDPRVSNTILKHLVGGINGASVARGTSFLKEKLGKQIFGKDIVILDDPHILRGPRSRPFDAEGIKTQPRTVIQDGVLQTWIMDLRSSRQLGLTTTGHASRGIGGAPSPSVSNFFMQPGRISPEDMIKAIPQGLYVTELIGQGVNGVTGDYSRGAVGFWIENGEITFPRKRNYYRRKSK